MLLSILLFAGAAIAGVAVRNVDGKWPTTTSKWGGGSSTQSTLSSSSSKTWGPTTTLIPSHPSSTSAVGSTSCPAAPVGITVTVSLTITKTTAGPGTTTTSTKLSTVTLPGSAVITTKTTVAPGNTVTNTITLPGSTITTTKPETIIVPTTTTTTAIHVSTVTASAVPYNDPRNGFSCLVDQSPYCCDSSLLSGTGVTGSIPLTIGTNCVHAIGGVGYAICPVGMTSFTSAPLCCGSINALGLVTSCTSPGNLTLPAPPRGSAIAGVPVGTFVCNPTQGPYCCANNILSSVLGGILSSAIGAQCSKASGKSSGATCSGAVQPNSLCCSNVGLLGLQLLCQYSGLLPNGH